MSLFRSSLAAFSLAVGIAATDVPEADAGQFRSYTFKGCTSDNKSVSQVFKWDMGLGKQKIQQQSGSVGSAFPKVVGRYSGSQLKGGDHLSSLLSGKVPKDGTVTFNPPSLRGSC